VRLIDVLTPARIRVPLASRDKGGILRELLEAALEGTNGPVLEDALQAVLEREAQFPTGIGYGVAVPHGKTATLPDHKIAAGTVPDPVAYETLDGQPVRLFFLLVGPESAAGSHVKLLSRIARLVRREPFRDRLLKARSAEEFYRGVCEAEGL